MLRADMSPAFGRSCKGCDVNMKKLMVNCLATTALTLVLLSGAAFVYQAKCLFVATIFQSLFANVIIHAGLSFIRKFESIYSIFEVLLKVGYTLGILIACGFLFNWYCSTPIWLVVVIGVAVYLIACLLDILRMNDDLSYINKELEKRKKQ